MSEMTQAAYAKHRGVSQEAVRQAIAAGRIPFFSRGRRKLIDADIADRAWLANTDPDQQQRGALKEFVKPARKRSKPGHSLLDEKIRAERLRIRRQEIELAELEGRMVDVERVKAAMATKLILARQRLESIPERYGAIFAAEKNAYRIEEILRTEIHGALTIIATGSLTSVEPR